MSRRRGRRGIAEFGLSFLDVISCGFGAIILLLIITKTVEPRLLEESQINLEGQIAQREQALYEIRGRISELRRQVTDAEAQLEDNLLQVLGHAGAVAQVDAVIADADQLVHHRLVRPLVE